VEPTAWFILAILWALLLMMVVLRWKE